MPSPLPSAEAIINTISSLFTWPYLYNRQYINPIHSVLFDWDVEMAAMKKTRHEYLHSVASESTDEIELDTFVDEYHDTMPTSTADNEPKIMQKDENTNGATSFNTADGQDRITYTHLGITVPLTNEDIPLVPTKKVKVQLQLPTEHRHTRNDNGVFVAPPKSLYPGTSREMHVEFQTPDERRSASGADVFIAPPNSPYLWMAHQLFYF